VSVPVPRPSDAVLARHAERIAHEAAALFAGLRPEEALTLWCYIMWVASGQRAHAQVVATQHAGDAGC